MPLKKKKKVQVIAYRVKETITQAWYRPEVERWLLIEILSDGSYKYYLSNAPKDISIEQLVLWAHSRWHIEQGYQQMKEELGLDHFEGRSWRGLHHHLVLCFAAFDFLTLLTLEKKTSLTFPQVRNWLNSLFSITQCPNCFSVHLPVRLPLFTAFFYT